MRRERFIIQGQVQGVGFRPFVFTLAEETGLTGFVRNSPRGVIIEAQGRSSSLRAFALALKTRLPPLAQVTGMTGEVLEPLSGETSFTIAQSSSGSSHAVLISPDTATCDACMADIADSGNRRFQYPFTNCTNCGPRYTITRSVPYDREFTSMACFPFCPECRAEYENPRDRRFHAQPNACPVCGPRMWFVDGNGERDPGGAANAGKKGEMEGDAAVRALARFLAEGGIAAVKGLGGFHLACDACNDDAVYNLRRRKNRPHKPFAVMAATLDEVRRFAVVGGEEELLLLSSERPIVICRLSGEKGMPGGLSAWISPDTASVGVMLPYTPLHAILFAHFASCLAECGAGGRDRPLVLVMTSGNPGGEPICLGNREALAQLRGMADAFLFHNRDILIRVDDSVVLPLPGRGTLFLRRARGHVPRPVDIGPVDGRPADALCFSPSGEREEKAEGESAQAAADAICALGVGAELKNTLCLTKGNAAFVGQHIGDMSNLETAAFHAEIRAHLTSLLSVSPGMVVRDLHPEYLSSRMAEEFGREAGIPVLSLQHHFAHAHAVLAEHGFRGRALALVLDGTGLGEDGVLWGGEILYVDSSPERTDGPAHKRLAHLAPLDLPGGEAAIREPWRIAHALLLRLDLADRAGGELPWLPERAATAAVLPALLARRVNTPASTSLGRFFDAVSALLGLCDATSYEGQAAIRLEEAQYEKDSGARNAADAVDFPPVYPCPVAKGESGCLQLDTRVLFAAIFAEKKRGTPLPVIARRFHRSIAVHLAALAARLAGEHRIVHVGLSGGCLQNRTLALALADELEKRGLTPLLHEKLPPGDGCISLGQATWGRLHPPADSA
jgi:hydrogenase maturation protein HypF